MKPTVLTHDTDFHVDDVFAVAVLGLKLGDINIVRSRKEEDIKSADYVVDTGLVYDPRKNHFDHHQSEGAGKRDNGIPYASFGLLWKEYGEELAGGKREAEIIDTKLVAAIDAHDNGVETSTSKFENVRDYDINDFFYSFLTHRGNTEEELFEVFIQLVGVAKGILEREILKAKEAVAGRDKVLKIYNESLDKRIIVLHEDLSWKDVLVAAKEPMFVIRQRADGKWGARAIPNGLHGYEVKKPFPANWSGKTDGELQTISGVADATFCHRGLFLAVAKSEEGAIALANKALEN